MEEPRYSLSQEKDLELCQVLAGWDRFESKIQGPSIIDFNLPGFSDQSAETHYGARAEVLTDLVRLQNDPEVIANPLVSKKMRAQEAFLRNLMGEHWDFFDYIEATQGFTPRLFTEQELSAQRNEMTEALSDLDITDDANLEKNLEAADDKIPEAEIGRFYRRIADRNTEVLEPIIGTVPYFNFKVEFADVDAYWSNWVDGEKMDYRLQFNRRNVKEHLVGPSSLLAFHEISSHLLQAAILNRQIGQGTVPRCMGLTTVHGPEQFQSEGLAQSLTYFLDTADSQNPFLIAKREISQYKWMVDNNLHIMINTGSTIEECVTYGREYMPFKPRIQIAHSLSSKVNNPQFRCYEHVYGASAFFFKEIAQRADGQQKTALLNRIYNEWLIAPLNPADSISV